MGPIILLAAAAAAGFVLYEHSKKASQSGISNNAIGAPRTVKGQSGETWSVALLPLNDPTHTLTEVIYQTGNVPAQPHMVIRYVQTGSDTTSRKLAATGQTTPGLIQAAMADFGVTGPVGT